MNRNSKHPGKSHRRKASATDRTHNRTGYRITGSWDQRPDRPAIRATPDRKAARRIARQMADEAAERARVFELDRAARAEADRLARARRDRDAARYARELMSAPPNTRTDRRARHTAGGR
jgi:hypothetical protein